MIRQVKRNTRERTEQIMGEDDELQEAGEGVIENNRKQEERTDKRVCVCMCLRMLCCKRKKKKKSIIRLPPVSLSVKPALSNHLLHPLNCFLFSSQSAHSHPLISETHMCL